MTSLKSLLIISLIGLGLIISSCTREYDGVFKPVINTPDTQEIIKTSLFGVVIDKNDQPVPNALVTLNTGVEATDMMTDDRGQFAFKDIENKGASAFLSIKSAGKFEAFRRYGVIKDRNNYTEIKMQDRELIGTVSASQGGTLGNGNGAEIEIPANGIIDGAGMIYTGDVSVGMAWIDPVGTDLASQMVGDLSAIDMEGNISALATYGMLQIELLDALGNELNLANGSAAMLQFPVPLELQANAPSTIPLWSYDEEIGTWIEEGSAIYANGVYRGSVTHFSSWNVDVRYDPIEISGQVKVKVEGKELGASYFSVYVKSDEIGKKGGWLCDDGSFLFYNFPKGEQFKLCIFDQCGNLKYEETYGPFQNNEDLGTIELTNRSSIVKIKGNALNCDGGQVDNGGITVDVDGRIYFFEMETDGTFEFALDLCERRIGKVSIVDRTSILKREFEFNDSQAIWELNDLELCDEFSNFVALNIGNEPQILLEPITYSKGTSTIYDGLRISLSQDSTSSNHTTVFILTFKHPTMVLPVTSEETEFFLRAGNSSYVLEKEGDIEVTTTQFNDESGGFIRGTYTGTVLDELTGESGIPISGEFRVPIE